MKLYNADFSPNCARVRAVIYELDLDVELVDINFMSQQERPPAFLAANPNGKVPVLVEDDGFTLFESRAINAYLAAKVPERDLYPADLRRRAIVDQWSYWQALQLGPAMQTVAFERIVKPKLGRGEPDQALVDAKMADVRRWLPILDRGLEGKEWVADALSIGDFAVASTFLLNELAGISLDEVPNVKAWIGRVRALDSWQRAVPRFS